MVVMKIIRKRKNKAGKLEMWVEEYICMLSQLLTRGVFGGGWGGIAQSPLRSKVGRLTDSDVVKVREDLALVNSTAFYTFQYHYGLNYL